MVSVVHSIAAQSDLEHSLNTLSEGLSAAEADRAKQHQELLGLRTQEARLRERLAAEARSFID